MIISHKAINILFSVCLILGLAACTTPSDFRTGATSILATEPGIMIELGYQNLGPNAPGFPTVLATEEINVRVYKDADEALASYKTFDFDYTNKANPLLEKELFHQLEKVLKAHGLTRAKEAPQILISMDFFSGKKEQYTPPTTITSTELQTVWNTGMIGWNVGGYSSQVPITSSKTEAGYTTISYYNNIRLNFLNRPKVVGTVKPEIPPLIWMGEVDNQGANSDIRTIAPVMFNELIAEFPSDSGKAAKRYLRCFRYGGLGLGFDPSDWRVVRHVEPSSVASMYAIKPGDMLVKINGESADNWANSSFWSSTDANSSNSYRANDPYFKYVLSNRGDVDVEIIVRSAETGKWSTHKMRPVSEDRYIDVNQYGYPLQKTTRTAI